MTKKPKQFSLGREVYNDGFREVISSIFTPSSAIHYCFTLPFQLPFKNGTRFHLIFNNHAIFFHFDKFEDSYKESIYDEDEGIKIAKLRTRTEALIITKEQVGHDEEYLCSYFIHILEKLNNYTYAYRLLYEDWKTKKVSPESLHCVILTSVYSLPEWNEVYCGPFMINRNYEQIITNLPPEHARAVEGFGMYLNTQNNPLIPSRKFFAESRSSLWNGEYQESVIYAQMCIESFLNNIYKLIRLAQGVETNNIDVEFENTSLISRIKKKISHELGGIWQLDQGNGAVHLWHSKVYMLRNRIVHGGYNVARHEAYEAFECAYVFCNYLVLRIKENKRKFPELAQYSEQIPEFYLQGEELKPRAIEVD